MTGIEAIIKLLAKHYKINKEYVKHKLYTKGFDAEKDDKAIKSTLLYKSIIDEAKQSEKKALEIHFLNDSFSVTLNKLIESKRKSIKKERETTKKSNASVLSSLSGISDHTLSRLRTKNGEKVSLQAILGICCGLSLSLPETEMLLDKSPFRLQPSIPEHYVYKSIIPLFKLYEINEINDILDNVGVRRIGNVKDTDAE